VWRILLILFLVAVPTARANESPTFQELEESLTCQCGCGLTVHSCNHLQCPSALPLRQEIREQMQQGLDKPAMLGHFADKYGEKILSSPTTTGFNLTAWITPFLALGIGSAVVMLTLVRWRSGRRRPVQPATLAPVDGNRAAAHERILERELNELDS
jgi:cytochrome c-type biogenesis protein CcmH